MEKVNIAVIGTGPAGLTALKALREEGFNAVAFERRDRVGGLWAHSSDPAFTSVIDGTVCNISKFVVSSSATVHIRRVRRDDLMRYSRDSVTFPCLEKDSPVYLTGGQVAEYFHQYAVHFKLLEHVRFQTTVRKVFRNAADDGWDIHITDVDGDKILSFHKVVIGSGNESKPSWPSMPGRDKFKGILIHGQAYRSPGQFQEKRVLVVGMGNTGTDTATGLCNHASKVRWHPFDIRPTWPVLCLKYLLDAWAPWLTAPLVDRLLLRKMVRDAARTEPELRPGETYAQRRARAEAKVRGDWRLADFPSLSRRHPTVNEQWFPAVQTGAIAPVRGFKAFVGEGEVLLDDGTVLEVDAVIMCTGYEYCDFGLVPELDMDGAGGLPARTAASLAEEKEKMGDTTLKGAGRSDDVPHLPRLYHLIFPPRWADSMAFLSCYAPQEAVWNVCDLASMAVAQIWAAATAAKSPQPPARENPKTGPATLPARAAMDRQVDAYHAWWRAQWAADRATLPGFVRADAFVRFLHGAAGTGLHARVDHAAALSCGGWRLWWDDRALYAWLARGPVHPAAYRVFETNPRGCRGAGGGLGAGLGTCWGRW
ncbi:dimethylaniline monooxygenase 2 [Apiospora kogelbergensis]|uniref:dimethylaniline monooxygenase 2 n=1 Tax=Apiospora kogelbergensis TaxID=1337665 RepID=UPI00312D0E80